MPDMFIPSSPQDYPIRPVMRGMITATAPTQAPDGSFALVRNLDVTMRGMRRLGAGPYVTESGTVTMAADILSRAEPEIWPGDRRGVGGNAETEIIL